MKKALIIIITALLTLSFSITNVAASGSFKDIKSSDSFYTAVNELSSKGIIGGFTDGTFRPGQSVTRGQAAKFLTIALNLKAATPSKQKFKDITTTHPFASYIHTLSDAGVIGGYTDNTFRPNDTITRAQMSKMLVSGFKIKAKSTEVAPYSDMNKTIWFATFVNTLYSHDVKLSKDQTKLSPNQLVTRGDVAEFIFNASKIANPTTGTATDQQVVDKVVAQVKALKLEPIDTIFIPYPTVTLEKGTEISWDLVKVKKDDQYYLVSRGNHGFYLPQHTDYSPESGFVLRATIFKGTVTEKVDVPITFTNFMTEGVALNYLTSFNYDDKRLRISGFTKEDIKSVDLEKIYFGTNNNPFTSGVNFSGYESSAYASRPGTYELENGTLGNSEYFNIYIHLTDSDFNKIMSLPGIGNREGSSEDAEFIYLGKDWYPGAKTTTTLALGERNITIDKNSADPQTIKGFVNVYWNGTPLFSGFEETRNTIRVNENIDRIILLNNDYEGFMPSSQGEIKPTDRINIIDLTGKPVPKTIQVDPNNWTNPPEDFDSLIRKKK